MNRIIALDVGTVRIGVASTDLLKIIASPFTVYTRKNLKDDLEYFKKLIVEREADTIVVGLPLSMDGSESSQTKLTREFVEQLKTVTDVKIVFSDERLSSYEAESYLLEGDVSRKKRKKVIDQIAASIILDNYLRNHQ